LSQVIVVGVIIGLYELLLRVINRIRNRKSVSLGIRKQHKKDKEKTILNRQKT